MNITKPLTNPSGMGPTQEDVDKFMGENQINDRENLFRAQYSTSCKSAQGVGLHKYIVLCCNIFRQTGNYSITVLELEYAIAIL